MLRKFTLEYWKDDDWYVGRLREVPGVFSQGETLRKLKDNIGDAYKLIKEDELLPSVNKIHVKEIALRV